MSTARVGLASPVGAFWAVQVFYAVAVMRGSARAAAKATRERGDEQRPSSFRTIMRLNMLTAIAPGVLWIVTLPLNRFDLPRWIAAFALPTPRFGNVEQYRWAGAALSALSFAFYIAALRTISGRVRVRSLHVSLIAQGLFSFFGPRPKHDLIDSGPFSIVRHPIVRRLGRFRSADPSVHEQRCHAAGECTDVLSLDRQSALTRSDSSTLCRSIRPPR